MIVTRLRGGLGNQMFQYAAGKAEAAKRGERLALDLSWFDGPGAVNPRREYDLGIFAVQHRRAGKLQTLVAKLRGRYMDGFFQSEQYFKDIAADIRKDFTFVDHIGTASPELYADVSGPNTVCVHVRRTDFVAHGMSLDVEYYRAAMSDIIRKSPHARFFIFSDDMAWCRSELAFIPDPVFVTDEHAGRKHSTYLQLMTACHHFIIPNSTFSWWAAWLSERPGKIVIAPKIWKTGPDTTNPDIVPSEWLTI